MKEKIFTISIAVLILSNVYGQKERYLTFEVGGIGGLASFSYEKSIFKSNKIKLIYRTSFSMMPIDRNNGSVLIFPQLVHISYGEKANKIDFGIGLSPSFTTTFNGAFIRAPLSFGYRIDPENKNYYWRLAYTPLVSFLVDFQWQHWGGITIGYKLKTKKEKE